MNEILSEIIIPNYPDKVLVSNRRIPVYFVSPTSSKRGKKKIPEKYSDVKKYTFNTFGYLVDVTTNQPVIANSKTVGKPRFWVVNFQDIWNQTVTKIRRAFLINKLKDILKPFIENSVQITDYPVEIRIYIFDTNLKTDISNKGVIYIKVIEDLLVKAKKLKGDSIDYVSTSGRVKFIKIQEEEEKKMIIQIIKSNYNFDGHNALNN